jgi:hypothetical protein
MYIFIHLSVAYYEDIIGRTMGHQCYHLHKYTKIAGSSLNLLAKEFGAPDELRSGQRQLHMMILLEDRTLTDRQMAG